MVEIIHDDLLVTDRLKLKAEEKNEILPSMYWMPKMHKNPTGQRFIIASKFCSTKPLSRTISSVFNLIYSQMENFHLKAKFLSNYNKFWVLKNVTPVTNILSEANRKRNAKSISTYDFSTLYTKIPHTDLVNTLCNLIDFVFEGGKSDSIRISKLGHAYWGNKTTKYTCFSKSSLKRAVRHLIENCHFTVGNLVMRQCIGIPMGIDPAPFWANLYLYYYEEKYISGLIGSDKIKARKFHAVKRFIDDLLALNDGGEFGRNHNNIYPVELELKLEHSGREATFLNLHIRIEDGKFVYSLYDKRDDFPFAIVRMPHRDSNIPEKIFYSAVVGEFLRIARSSMLYPDFLPKARDLLVRMKNQGATVENLKRSLKKIIENHPETFASYSIEMDNVLNDILI